MQCASTMTNPGQAWTRGYSRASSNLQHTDPGRATSSLCLAENLAGAESPPALERHTCPCGIHSLPYSAGMSQKLLGIAQFLAKRYRGFHDLRDPSTYTACEKTTANIPGVFFSHSFPFLFSFVTFSTEVAIDGETISKDQFLFITRTDYAILAWDRGLEGIAKPEKMEPWPLR